MIKQGTKDHIALAQIIVSFVFMNIGKGKVPAERAAHIYKISLNRWNSKEQSRVMYSIRDPTLLRKGAENILIKNLEKGIDQKDLHDTFSVCGNILFGKLASYPADQSQGYGFIQFDNEESAKKGNRVIECAVVIKDVDEKSNELQIHQRQMTPLELLCCQVEEI
ncbi:hypothetical protein GQ457_10G009510 [Hibiscus cannabinus]